MPTINHQYQDGCWPTPEQEWLLRAALLEGEASLNAWHKWKSTLDFDHIDPGSQRLVPLLYHNLQCQGVKDPLMGKFKGLSRHAWYKNQLLFAQGADLLRAFHEAGIKTMILKGAALVQLKYYQNAGLRPMQDFDLLVPTAQAQAAIELLLAQNWTPIDRSPDFFTDLYLSCWHGDSFTNKNQEYEVDLHWHLLEECCYANADDVFWENAVPLQIGDVSTQALNPTDQLLHTCIHGARWNTVPPLRWVADAFMILRRSSEIDWQRLVAQAHERRLVLPLRKTLTYLRNLLDVPVPHATLQHLQTIPVSQIEQLEYHLNGRPRSALLGYLPIFWFRYRRHAHTIPLAKQLVGFPSFLQHFFEIERAWQLPFYVAYAGTRNVRNWAKTGVIKIGQK